MLVAAPSARQFAVALEAWQFAIHDRQAAEATLGQFGRERHPGHIRVFHAVMRLDSAGLLPA